MRRGRTREAKMRVPGFFGRMQIRKNVRTVEDIARAVGVDHLIGRNGERRQVPHIAAPVIPNKPAGSQSHAADAAAFLLEQRAEGLRTQLELLAQPLRAYCNVDMPKQLERIGTQAAAVERGEDASLDGGGLR